MMESSQNLGQEVSAGMRGCAQDYRIALPSGQIVELRTYHCRVAEHSERELVHDASGFGELGTAAFPLKQPCPVCLLQSQDVSADGWLGHRQDLGGAREALLLCDCAEHCQAHGIDDGIVRTDSLGGASIRRHGSLLLSLTAHPLGFSGHVR